jgi:NAD(P)-dependent dehydrogenase (short-subunit alcohol dehydrogenase family)
MSATDSNLDSSLGDISMTGWSTADIPSLNGKTAVITGATGGLGYETALALAGAGAAVVLTGRSEAKGRIAIDRIRAQFPDANISYETLDLADLASVADFSKRFAATHASLDLLVNNAGVMALPQRQVTSDGFEMQFGTNYLGHYALTAHLLPQLRRGNQPRVVNLSSLTHRWGAIHFDDLQGARSYSPQKAYSQSKLAMLMFALELQRRSDAAGWGLMSNAAHPGYARTDLIANGPGASGLLWQLNKALRPFVSSVSRRRRAAHLVCRDLAGGQGSRLLRPGRVLRIEGAAGAGEVHAAGERRSSGGTALGCLGQADRCIVRPGRGRRLSLSPNHATGNRMQWEIG